MKEKDRANRLPVMQILRSDSKHPRGDVGGGLGNCTLAAGVLHFRSSINPEEETSTSSLSVAGNACDEERDSVPKNITRGLCPQ